MIDSMELRIRDNEDAETLAFELYFGGLRHSADEVVAIIPREFYQAFHRGWTCAHLYRNGIRRTQK